MQALSRSIPRDRYLIASTLSLKRRIDSVHNPGHAAFPIHFSQTIYAVVEKYLQ